MRLRFKSLLFFVGILIIACAVIGIGFFFYKEVVIGSDIVVDGDLTINYIDGKKFKLNGNNTVEFSVTNNSEEQRFYYIELADVYANDVTYNLKSTSNLDIKNKLESSMITNLTAINGNETIKYSITFETNNSEKYYGTIQIGRKEDDSNTFINVLLANNNISNTLITNIGEPSTIEEGLIPIQDEDGVAYYFRGAVSNNNVNFAGLNWKIVKINGNNTIKLVLNSLIPDLSKYSDNKDSYEESIIKDTLSNWYKNNLEEYSEYLIYCKFCNDSVINSNSEYYAYTRLITDKNPNSICVGNIVSDKIGLLTADEVMLAGGSEKENTKYYLYNSNITTAYYTMTSAKNSGNVYYPFMVNTNGALITNTGSTLLRGVRPVINIVKNAKVSGDGTTDNPYNISL